MIKYPLSKKGYTLKKFLASIIFLASLSSLNAGIVDAVAITVNDEPITLYDIDERMQRAKVSKNEAVGQLMDEILYKQELKNNNIEVDYLDISNYIDKLAQRNGMDSIDFKAVIRQRYPNYEVFEQEVRERLMREKLVAKIVQGNIKRATEEDLQLYYDKNKSKYNSASAFEVTEYKSKSRNSLIEISKNPMAKKDDVEKNNITVQAQSVSPQAKYILNSTNENSFTPVFTIENSYVMFFIKSKKDFQTQSFNEVKENIFMTIMNDREQKFLKEYFEKVKLKAKIEVKR